MDKIITVQGKNIQMEMTQHKVKLVNNDQLSALLVHNTEASTDELVTAIKAAFQQQNNRDLDISNASMAVEIWGHIYAEKFADALKDIAPVKLISSLAQKITAHCEVINIGKKDHDNNRFIWDWLSVFKPAIAAILLKGDD